MQSDRIVEEGPAGAVFTNPHEAYTRDLLDAIPGRPLPTKLRATTRDARMTRTLKCASKELPGRSADHFTVVELCKD